MTRQGKLVYFRKHEILKLEDVSLVIEILWSLDILQRNLNWKGGNPNSKEGQFCGMSDETFGKEAVPARDSQESEVSRFQNSILKTHMNLKTRRDILSLKLLDLGL
eukprot:scaffold2047_cov129-Cylindrotheca_fusiformis.AAC.5